MTVLLGSPGPTRQEKLKKSWDLPKELRGGVRVCKQTNSRLFHDFPDWIVIAVYNHNHTYDITLRDGRDIKGAGVWWIWEANPKPDPRVFGKVFPVCVSTTDDGVPYIDEDKGEPVTPLSCYDVILRRLKSKDLFGATDAVSNPENYLKMVDHAEVVRQERIEGKIIQLGQDCAQDEIADGSTVKGGSKSFVPSTYEPLIKVVSS